MKNHFDKIANIFNRIWYFSDEYKAWIVEKIIYDMLLTKQDILVDIGGGTGTFADLLKNKTKLQTAYCIEPSIEMCAIAKGNPNINTICINAEEFAELKLGYTKVLLKEVVHHLTDRAMIWEKIYYQLPDFGRILIVTRPQLIEFPLFNEAKQKFSKNQPTHESIKAELKKCGFNVNVEFREFAFTLPMEIWIDMIRNRFMSDLSSFTEQEIEKGVDEILRENASDQVHIKDKLIFISAWKL